MRSARRRQFDPAVGQDVVARRVAVAREAHRQVAAFGVRRHVGASNIAFRCFVFPEIGRRHFDRRRFVIDQRHFRCVVRRRTCHRIASARYFAFRGAPRCIEFHIQRIDTFRNPQQSHKGRAAISATGHITGSGLLEQFVEVAALPDRFDDPVGLVVGGEQRRIAGVRFGVAEDLGIDRQGFVVAQHQAAAVVRGKVDLRARKRYHHVALENRITHFEFAHRAVFPAGKSLALNGGNMCDGYIGCHDRSS